MGPAPNVFEKADPLYLCFCPKNPKYKPSPLNGPSVPQPSTHHKRPSIII